MRMSEFSLAVPLARLSTRPSPFAVMADEAIRNALARRFDLLGIDRLEASLEVMRDGDGAAARGSLVAEVKQACVVSAEPVVARVALPLEIRFRPLSSVAAGDDIELDPDALDTVLFEGEAIDLAEAVAQSLALALDPYPRAGKDAQAGARRFLISEEAAEAQATARANAANPFSVLKRD